jgi:hypothetical protein
MKEKVALISIAVIKFLTSAEYLVPHFNAQNVKLT